MFALLRVAFRTLLVMLIDGQIYQPGLVSTNPDPVRAALLICLMPGRRDARFAFDAPRGSRTSAISDSTPTSLSCQSPIRASFQTTGETIVCVSEKQVGESLAGGGGSGSIIVEEAEFAAAGLICT